MRRLFLTFLISIPLLASDYVPNRYIVELTQPSVAAQAKVLHTLAAEQHRGRVRAQQGVVRIAIEQRQGRVRRQLENVANALIVEIPDAQAGQLATIPGVRKVYPVRTFHLFLDHALPLHKVPDAWNQVGIANAGAGSKVAIIDTGIELKHPGFNDSGFSAPSGYPLADGQDDLAFTNNKVIVARSYASFFSRQDPDPTVADHVGHGTATAMAAAGVMNSGPLATISGVAPRAYLGVYKVFGTPGVNDGAPEDAILTAIEDAVNDGMDVISMSLGSDLATRLQDDPEVQVLQTVSAMGVIVVASAGNNGPDPGTIATPATTPSVISVGASANDRFFTGTLQLPDSRALVATPAAMSFSPASISAALSDVANLDGTGLACSALPAGSLSGMIALIFRGTCTFESKLNIAQAAGAVGAVVYDNVPGEDPITMGIGAATLPAEMIGNADGLALRTQLAGGLTVTLQFSLSAAFTNPARIASFSAEGPNVDSGIKPDMVAVGMNVYTAAETLDPNGALYDASGYSLEQGTSFSAPLVAGAAAFLKAARPGLTVDQYRSLLINSAAQASLVPNTVAGIQQAGGGVLDVLAALNASITAAPVSLSFGVGASAPGQQTLTLTNVGAVSDTYNLSVASQDSTGVVPQLLTTSVQLDPGANVAIPVLFPVGPLAPGAYQGFINVQGTVSTTVTHVGYWFGMPSDQAAHVTVLYNAGTNGSPSAGSRLRQAVVFHMTDAAGLPVSVQPTITAVTPGASALNLNSVDSVIPNAFTFDVRLSAQPGANVFQIQAGGATASVTITGR